MNVIAKQGRCNANQGRIKYLDEETKSLNKLDVNVMPFSALISQSQSRAVEIFLNEAKNIKKKPVVHLIFSLSEDYVNRLKNAHFDPLRTFNYIIDETIDKYSKLTTGQPNGLYALRGFHTQTDNLHAHILFLKRSVDGDYLPTSTCKWSNLYTQADFFRFFQAEAEKISVKIIKNPDKYAHLLNDDYIEKIVRNINPAITENAKRFPPHIRRLLLAKKYTQTKERIKFLKTAGKVSRIQTQTVIQSAQIKI